MTNHTLHGLLAAALLVGSAYGIPTAPVLQGVSDGPDVTTLHIGFASGTAILFHGESGGVRAYSFANTACNLGDTAVPWISSPSHDHPVVGQNLFRVHGGRIEQLGYSFVKHGFCALNEAGCATCEPSACTTLGAGCATTNSAGLLDGSFGGSKADVDAATGFHAAQTAPVGDPALAGRLRVSAAEMSVAGAVYVAEQQQVSHADHLAGNARNDASWREVDVSGTALAGTGPTVVGDPAIYAWQALDSGVTIREVVLANEGGPGVHGTFFLGYKTTDLGGGEWRYEYALQNLTSSRSARSFAIPVPGGASDLFFRDVDPHSGDPYSAADWTPSIVGGAIEWSTDTFAVDPNANALRWGTLYNFGFTADRPPVLAVAEIGLFVPGASDALFALVEGPRLADGCAETSFCSSTPNSTGFPATIATNLDCDVGDNGLLLVASPVPDEFGLFFYGSAQQAGGSGVTFGNGLLCVGGGGTQIHRLPVVQAAENVLFHSVDFADPPTASGTITAGSTWNFQAWFRDPSAGGAFFDLSDGVTLTFQ